MNDLMKFQDFLISKIIFLIIIMRISNITFIELLIFKLLLDIFSNQLLFFNL